MTYTVRKVPALGILVALSWASVAAADGWPDWAERWLFNSGERTVRALEATGRGQAEEAVRPLETALRLAGESDVAAYNAGTGRLDAGVGDPSALFEGAAGRGPADLARIFGDQFFFGCESDDASVHRALDGPGNKLGVTLRALFSSDIGHWDVPRLTDPVPQSWQLVEKGLLPADDYRRFVFELTARLHLGMNPAFFDGTRVEEEAKKRVAADSSAQVQPRAGA